MRGLFAAIAALFAAALVLLGAAGCATAAGARDTRIPAGRAMVVVAPDPVPADDQASEAYADWAGYLNDFATGDAARGLTIVRLTPAQWRSRVGAPRLTDAYATAFVRADVRAILYQGMIVEPQRYTEGNAWITGTGAMPADGFVAIRVRRAR